MNKSYPIRFITNGTKFGIEYLKKEIEYETLGFWDWVCVKDNKKIEKEVWCPLHQYSGDSLNGFNKHRMVFDSLAAARQWVIDQNKKEEGLIKNETWKVVE
jgi:hypothetical protein